MSPGGILAEGFWRSVLTTDGFKTKMHYSDRTLNTALPGLPQPWKRIYIEPITL